MIVDTSLFIDFTRGYTPSRQVFKDIAYGQSASIITELELIIGTKTKAQLREISVLLKSFKISIIPLNEDYSILARDLVRSFYHSHSLNIGDSLIAATALARNEELATRNRKHFQFIPNLKIIAPY